MILRSLKLGIAVCALACATHGTSLAAAVTVARGIAPIQSMLAPKSVRKLYVVDVTNNAIDLFPAGIVRPKQIGAITQGVSSPFDAFVDARGRLYVANAGSRTVTEYAAGTSVPDRTIALGDVKPIWITAGPDGTVYVMVHNKYQRWHVLEFDLGASKPSRTIDIPYEYPYPLVGGGIAVNDRNFLFMNSGSYSGQGDFFVSIFPPKSTKATGGFTSGGYAGGGVQIFAGLCFVGDPGSNDVELWSLPLKPKYRVRYFKTESSGDFLTYDTVSHFLYSVSYGSQTLQIYDFRNGHLLNFLSGFGRGVAIDPAGDGS